MAYFMKHLKNGDLRVWWMPQVTTGDVFYSPVDSPREAQKLIGTLAYYDQFQYRNNIKPDYSNAGGLEVFEDGQWLEWEDPETGDNIEDWEPEE